MPPFGGVLLAPWHGIVKQSVALAEPGRLVVPLGHWPAHGMVSPVLFDHLPAEHSWHCASEVSPVWADHLPAEQWPWHWASELSPIWADHLPAEHSLVQVSVLTTMASS